MKSISDPKMQCLPPLTVPLPREPHPRSHAALASQPPSTSPSQPSRKSRIPSTSPLSPGVKRAASPSSMQEDRPDQSDASAAALADKKRNKLGYHRTSVACVHCRRRKIRCLVAPDDPQGRCQNCIRLKKECNFYPVDQQPPNERQRRTAQRGTSQTSSSPAPSSANPHEQMNPYPPPPMPMGYAPAMGSIHGSGMPMAPIETGSYSSPMRGTWDPSYMESPMSAGGQVSEVGTPGYWKSPVSGEYSSYSSQPESARSAHFPGGYGTPRQDSWAQGMPQSQQSTPVHPLASSQMPIQAQPRSLSLQQDSSGGIYGGPPQISDSPYYDTRGPPSLYASTGSPATSVSLSDGTSAPGQTQPSATMPYAGMQGQSWDPSKAGMEYGAPSGWYPEPGHLSHAPDGPHSWAHAPGNYKPE